MDETFQIDENKLIQHEQELDELLRSKYRAICKEITKGYDDLSHEDLNVFFGLANKYDKKHINALIEKMVSITRIVSDTKISKKEAMEHFVAPLFNSAYERYYIPTVNILLAFLIAKEIDLDEIVKKIKSGEPSLAIFAILLGMEDKSTKSWHKLKMAQESLDGKVAKELLNQIFLFEANRIRNGIAHSNYEVTEEGEIIIHERGIGKKKITINDKKYTYHQIMDIIYDMFEISAVLRRAISLSFVFKSSGLIIDHMRKEIEERGFDLETMEKEEFFEVLKEMGKENGNI